MSKAFPVNIIAGLISIAAMYSGLTGRRVPFINDARTAVIVIGAAGFVMCSTGLIGLFVTNAPAHPLTIAGYLLGILALLATVVQIFGLKVPYLSDPQNGLIVITAITIIKIVIARFNYVLK